MPNASNLHYLNLRALPTTHLPLDRILTTIAINPIPFSAFSRSTALPVVLPLFPLTPTSEDPYIGGHYHLITPLDNLVLPTLTTLTLDIEARGLLNTLLLLTAQTPLPVRPP